MLGVLSSCTCNGKPVRNMLLKANGNTCIGAFHSYYTLLLLIIDIYFDVQINLVLVF